MNGTPVTCVVCGNDRFVGARRLQHLNLSDGTVGRSWTTGLEDAAELICSNCQTRYVWNAKTLVYDQQPPYTAQTKKKDA